MVSRVVRPVVLAVPPPVVIEQLDVVETLGLGVDVARVALAVAPETIVDGTRLRVLCTVLAGVEGATHRRLEITPG